MMRGDDDDYDLYGGHPPHEDSGTSREAAEAALPNLGAPQAEVYMRIRAHGEWGCTDDELELQTGLSHQGVSARRRELVLRGAVRDSGRRRRTSRGRWATVWVLGLDLAPRRNDDSPATVIPSRGDIALALASMKDLYERAGKRAQHGQELARVVAWLKALT